MGSEIYVDNILFLKEKHNSVYESYKYQQHDKTDLTI
jgi:hypothetical protein